MNFKFLVSLLVLSFITVAIADEEKFLVEHGWYTADSSETEPTIKLEIQNAGKVSGYVDRHTQDGKTDSIKGSWTSTKSKVVINFGKQTCYFEYKQEMLNGAGTLSGPGLVPLKGKAKSKNTLCELSYINSK